MQAIELVARDDFLFRFNVSIDTSDLIDYLHKATLNWNPTTFEYTRESGSYTHYIDFMQKFVVPLAEIMTSRGFCYSFNIVDASELFHLERLQAFHCDASY
jgi:hypothetical protein